MIPPLEPKNEARRLASLRGLKLLDTNASDERFDRITRLAKIVTRTPISLLSLVDAQRQWFKSRQGLDASETPRDISFCGHAILGEGLFIVPDATKDPRFADNPLVTSRPAIRLYAGCPLKAPDGQVVGTLCVIDNRARDLAPDEREALALLGAMVENEFRLLGSLGENETVIENLTRYKTLIETSDDAIITTTANGIISSWNPGAERMFGYTAHEALGRKSHMLIPKARQDDDLHYVEKISKGEHIEHFQTFRMRKDKTQLWVSVSLSPLRDSFDAIVGASMIVRDITALKDAEKAILSARDSALQTAKAKADFLATMSHEIRTPMNAIIGMTDLLADTPLTSLQQDYVKTVSGASEALLALINDILDFSKIESGMLTMEKYDFDLPETVDSLIELLAPSAQSKGVGLTKFIEKGVPPRLRGDQRRLRQVLLNLLGNALKFTETGEVGLRVSKESETGEGTVLRFSVKDTGLGIPATAQKNLFQVFTQADASTTRKYGGTGLGLSICKKLVELMGGKIGFESEPGKGSNFWFLLPFEKFNGAATAPLHAAGAAKDSPEKTKAPRKYFKILIAEDNIINQKVALRQLSKLGYEADMAANGLEVLKAMDSNEYDLILMDCQMPEMDGFETARQIRAHEKSKAGRDRRVSIVAMTANALEGDRGKCLESGMDDYLSKPIRIEVLTQMLEHYFLKAGIETGANRDGIESR